LENLGERFTDNYVDSIFCGRPTPKSGIKLRI